MPNWIPSFDPRKRFAQKLVGRLRKEPWVLGEPVVDLEREELRCALESGGDKVWSFRAAADTYAAEPKLREQLVTDSIRLIRPWPTAEAALAELGKDLVATVRHRAWFETAALRVRRFLDDKEIERTSQLQVLTTPLTDVLWMGLAIDTPSLFAHATVSTLAGWGISLEAAWERARANLAARTGRCEVKVPDGSAGVGAVVFDDRNAAARLAFPHFLRTMARNLAGHDVEDVFVLLADADTIILADARDEEAVGRAWTLKLGLDGKTDPVSQLAMILTEDGFQPWLTTSRLLGIFASMSHAGEAQSTYALQHEELVRIAGRIGVAELEVFEGDTTLTTVTRWCEGEELLLPDAEQIVLMTARGAGTTQMPMERLLRQAPDSLVRRVDLFPIRYQTSRCPAELTGG